mgnify:CR=1 FL=1
MILEPPYLDTLYELLLERKIKTSKKMQVKIIKMFIIKGLIKLKNI